MVAEVDVGSLSTDDWRKVMASRRSKEIRMPGTFATVYLVAFDLDDRDQAIKAFSTRVAASEAAAIQEAQDLGERHAGAIVWKREGYPVVGEEGEPEVIFSVGRVGDFD